MKKSLVFACCLLGAGLALGQEPSLNLDDLAKQAQEWANDNLDDQALQTLQSGDQEKVRKLFAELQRQFQGEYVVDLAAVRDTAKAVLPLLESSEETAPYAAWLRTRLDYLDVAEQLRLTIPPPKSEPDQPPRRAPNPPAQAEREIWISKLSERPWPKNAKPYVPQFKSIFSAQRVPAELIWIAEVESSFDSRARSPEGAAGMFQLMPATARRFKLHTGLFDERYKPEPSARAAAQYLHYLYGHFKDWRLALAAYNAGEGTVQNLLTRHKAHSYDAIAPYLPAETQLYVPKVEATILKREGLRLAQLRERPLKS